MFHNTKADVSPASVLLGLFVLAVFYTLYFIQEIARPLVFAILLAMLLLPVVRWLKYLRIPTTISAALIVLSLLGVFIAAVLFLSEPALNWLQKAPAMVRDIEERISPVRVFVDQITRAARHMERIAGISSELDGVQLVKPGLRKAFFTEMGAVAFGVVVTFFLLYFFLALGDVFLRKLVEFLPRFELKRRAVVTVRQVQHQVSRYLFTITLINTTLGILVGILMYIVDMPNPFLWGAMAGILNFIPYLGPTVTLIVIAGVSLLTFEVEHALVAPALFFIVTSLEGQLFTPLVVGHRMALNPVIVFLSIVFWGWMWGIVGALMAVPIMVTIKIVCDHVKPLMPVGFFLGR